MPLRICLAVWMLAWGVLAFAQGPTPPPRLKPGDRVEILVFGHEGYGGDFTLFEDGTIHGKGFGRLYASGMSTEELRAEVRKRLAETIKDPIVTVVLRAQRPLLMYVIGSGPGGGVINLAPGMDVRQLVARISLPSDPDLLDVTLYRKSGEQIKIDLHGVLQGNPKAWNGLLEADDIVAFLPKPYMRVWFIGPFGKTGQLRLREGLDIYEVLAEVGGVNTGSLTQDEAHLLIRRGPEMLRVPVRKDPVQSGLVLEAGDVVMLDQPKTIRVVVAGEIESAGEFVIREDLPLSRLMLMTRGATGTGTLSNIIVFRGDEVLQVDATGPITGQKPSEYRLQNGDFLYVQKNDRYVYAFGAVNQPGKLLVPDGVALRAADVFAMAGGLSEKGSLRRVHLMRADKSGKYATQVFHLDEYFKDGKLASNPEVRPGDLLLFGEPRGFTIDQVARVIGAAFMVDTVVRR